MTAAVAQRIRRKKHKQHKRCLWCKRRTKKALCSGCGRKHKLARRAQWTKTRPTDAKRYTCRFCGQLGHNSRRHKKQNVS